MYKYIYSEFLVVLGMTGWTSIINEASKNSCFVFRILTAFKIF